MKALGLVFSARAKGNCLGCAEFVLARLAEAGFETEVLNMYEHSISPCGHCAYECFKDEKCPIDDDIPRIYEKVRDADVLVFVIPTYGSNVSGLYKAFAERGQAVMKGLADYKTYIANKIKGFIVIGSIPGGDKAFHMVIPEYCESEHETAALLLQPDESGNRKAWLDGSMIKSHLIQSRLDHFVDVLRRQWDRKQEKV